MHTSELIERRRRLVDLALAAIPHLARLRL
jgi:hypothetical protein